MTSWSTWHQPLNQYSNDTQLTLNTQKVDSQMNVGWPLYNDWKLVDSGQIADQDVDGVLVKY